VGMLIRNYLEKHYRGKDPIIRGLLLLPGVMESKKNIGETEQQSFRRNGYAAIKELNAFWIKTSGNCEVRKDLERFKDLHVDIPADSGELESLEGLPFDFCFLLDRIDQQQTNMETLDQYINFAAQSLYEQSIGPMQQNAFSMEDNVVKLFSENESRNRFGGIGASVLRYPYADVVNYVAYSKALDRIGGGNSAGDWTQYDKEYKELFKNFKQRRSATGEKEPERGKVYTGALNSDTGMFASDIKAQLCDKEDKVLQVITKEINSYLGKVFAELLSGFVSDPTVASWQTSISELQSVDYSEDKDKRGDKKDCINSLNIIRNYIREIDMSASSVARSKARSMFFYAPSLQAQGFKQYHLESLLCSNDGGLHPSAIRYKLYVLLEELEKQQKAAHGTMLRLTSEDGEINLYSSSPKNPAGNFEISLPGESKKEKSIDEIVNHVKDPSFIEKIGGFDKIWSALSGHFQAYSNAVIEYRDAVIKDSAYMVACQYVQKLCEEFELFYDGFEKKVDALKRRKTDIIETLEFRKGEVIANVCATQKHLDEFVSMCQGGSDGLLLPGSLNAEIFDSVKKNVGYKREADSDVYKENTMVDIFDVVLLNYFREAVQEDFKETIDLNIIQALVKEQYMNELFIQRETKKDDEKLPPPSVSESSKSDYIQKKVEFGKRLAAPGISGPRFCEPREVSACAYNKELDNMRNIRMPSLLQKLEPVSAETVSRYEFRFFNALYNLTADNLARFINPEDKSYSSEDFPNEQAPGLYYTAYQKYMSNIGPDSTKSATITPHIDKRWDSVAVLPEIDLHRQKEEMIKIHSSLIYGLIHGVIRTRRSSEFDKNKRIFELEDLDGELMPFNVSNGTECDEFYEVLDALYRDRASVRLIYEIAQDRRKYDIEKNHRYEQSVFCQDLTGQFKVGDSHDSPTSLFEVPLIYYNSLPRLKLDDNELSIMVDSVIRIIEEEVGRFEKLNDQAPYICMILTAQFKLLIENFKKYDMGKNTSIEDDTVISMVFRKVTNKLKSVQMSDCEPTLQELRNLLKASKK